MVEDYTCLRALKIWVQPCSRTVRPEHYSNLPKVTQLLKKPRTSIQAQVFLVQTPVPAKAASKE